jgi:hypothetical protein
MSHTRSGTIYTPQDPESEFTMALANLQAVNEEFKQRRFYNPEKSRKLALALTSAYYRLMAARMNK